MSTPATGIRALPTWARVVIGVYAAVLLILGVRGLVPAWESFASPHGRGFGAWSMYGDHAEVVSITATVDGRELDPEGIWHGDFVSAATPYLPQSVVDDYARFLHERAGLGPDETVEVVVEYTVNEGPIITVKGSYP